MPTCSYTTAADTELTTRNQLSTDNNHHAFAFKFDNDATAGTIAIKDRIPGSLIFEDIGSFDASDPKDIYINRPIAELTFTPAGFNAEVTLIHITQTSAPTGKL
jgi:hypothetical protein